MANPTHIKTSIKIMAPSFKVWEVLLDPLHTQQWGSAFSEGAWVEADWKKGGLLIWKDRTGDIGAKGIVQALERNRLIEIAYFDEVNSQPPPPTGAYKEILKLSSLENKSLLTIEAGPLTQESIQKQERAWEDALERIKRLAETLG